MKIIEKEHRFFRDTLGVVWREGHVAERIFYLDGRAPIKEEIARNLDQVCYAVDQGKIETKLSAMVIA